MYYSRTDRHERSWPTERPYARKNMPMKYWHVFGETAPPRSVAHRSAIDARDDNGRAYARELLGEPRGDRKPRVAPLPPKRTEPVIIVPKDPAKRKSELDKTLAQIAKLKAQLAALG